MIADKLKKSVLQAAIQGKLTKQLPTDGDAKDLLEKIRAEKSNLIAEGKIKKEKSMPPISAEEIPFDIPDNWIWCRLGNLTKLITKGSSPKWQGINYVENGVLFITSENVGREGLLLNQKKYVEEKFNVLHPQSILQSGDILTNIVGASIGRTTQYSLNCSANINQAVSVIRMIDRAVAKYVVKFFNSPTAYKIMMNQKVETARANISLTNISEFLIPLPPLAEQKRIVERVEEILSEVEQLAESERELEELEKNFPRRMKNSILQAAIQGKLTTQLANDGDAKDLLEKIRAEKLKLIAEGKIKVEKNLPPISADEILFDIPDNWMWCRLGEICEIYTGNSIAETEKKSKYLGLAEGLSYIGTKDVSFDNKIDYDNGVKIPFKNNFRRALKDSVLLCIEGGSAGRKIALTDREICFGNKLCNFYSEIIFNRYIYFYLQSPTFRKNFYDNLSGMIGGVSIKKLNLMPICLPPLAEQKRIVERLEELLPLCVTG